MQERKLLLIYNPHSGKAHVRSKLNEMVELYTKYGYSVTVCPTQREKDAVQIVAKLAEHFDMIVCSGGDGTISEVFNGLLAVEHKPCNFKSEPVSDTLGQPVSSAVGFVGRQPNCIPHSRCEPTQRARNLRPRRTGMTTRQGRGGRWAGALQRR